MKPIQKEEKLTRIEIVLAAVAGAVGATVVIASLALFAPDPVQVPGRGGVVDRATKERMRYHGTDSAICDSSSGVESCWFYRDGKKIKL